MGGPQFTPNNFWARVEMGAWDECWPWPSAPDDDYGRIKYQGRMTKAHRVAWELTRGPIPDGMQICHRCDYPPCCNPNHLFLGTPRENSDDKVRKGRAIHYRTHMHPQAALTVAQVKYILDRPELPQNELAARLGTTIEVISGIRRERRYVPIIQGLRDGSLAWAAGDMARVEEQSLQGAAEMTIEDFLAHCRNLGYEVSIFANPAGQLTIHTKNNEKRFRVGKGKIWRTALKAWKKSEWE